MELTIGTTLRQLRRRRGLTQEETAEQLCVSPQAISKWEPAEGYPDITMLPALATFYGVTVDELLGGGSRDAQYEEINRAWAEDHRAGRHEANARRIQEALQDFPGDELLLVQLAASLEKLGDVHGAALVQEQILRVCGDGPVRSATQFNICFTYEKLGRHDKALAQAESCPISTRPGKMRCTADGGRKEGIAVFHG